MSTQQTVKCPICGKPYIFYAFSAADQSACPKCVAEAREGQGHWVDATDYIKNEKSKKVKSKKDSD